MMTAVLLKLKKRFLPTDNDARELVKKSSTAAIMRLLGFLTNYAFLYYVTRKYGAAGWGVFTLCYTVLQFTSTLGSLGMNTSLVKVFALKKYTTQGLMKQVVRLIIPINIALSILIYFLSDEISLWLNDGDELGRYIRYIAIGITPFTLTMLNAAVYKGLKKIATFNFFDSLGRFFVGGIAIWICSFFVTGERAIVIGFVIGIFMLLAFSSSFFVRIRETNSDENRQNRMPIKELMSLSMSLYWTPLTVKGLYWFSIFLLGRYTLKEDVGLFDACLRIASLTSIVLFSVNSISSAQFAESSEESELQRLQKKAKQGSRLIFWFSVPLIIGLMVTGKWVLSLLGEDFSAGYLPLIIILVGELINNISGSVGVLMQMAGLHRQFQSITFIILAVNILLNVLLIPKYGILGAAITTCVCTVLKNIIGAGVIFYKKKIMTIYIPFLTQKGL